MEIGDKIKKVREAKKLSQKEVALTLNMDQSQYSKIEKGKTDPTTATLEKICKALNIEVAELFVSDQLFKNVDSLDKSLVEKVHLLEQLDESEKQSIFQIIDSLIIKKRLKDTLNDAINLAS
ncbi:helix-turn-helix domain-containing protein [Microscilla marina]|uniref:Cryptic phage CTXphi transcriptional repressor RstR n=2 Tax=Microscilla marina TaxID=1027 RepID=A1ZZV7_MICM2|nr:helix-turn-helix transcriptional regulator [Microscilla marina]EAY24073.1 cryptic phage CTXphi transcriptional repressor RstR [Microscilla marina ATCC 23134]